MSLTCWLVCVNDSGVELWPWRFRVQLTSRNGRLVATRVMTQGRTNVLLLPLQVMQGKC